MTHQLCDHGKLWPCWRCTWRARLEDLARGGAYTFLCIVLCAIAAVAWIGIAQRACGASYCGTCDLDLQCPSGCACDARHEICVRVG